MSLTSIARAAADEDLISRVTSAAYQLVQTDPDIANTVLGQQLISGAAVGVNPVAPLMWPVASATEAAYETALVSGRGSPGFDKDIITDASIQSSVAAAWPMTRPAVPGGTSPTTLSPTVAPMVTLTDSTPTEPVEQRTVEPS
jgi:hypothetical protein